MISRRKFGATLALLGGSLGTARAASVAEPTGTIRAVTLSSKLVPGPVETLVYLPVAAATSTEKLPLMLLLHGGNGSAQDLLRFVPTIDAEMAAGRVPPMAIAMPSARRSLYMDYRDGSERWESMILTELLPRLRAELPLSGKRADTLIGGISMGGLGCLRLAFKHPDQFAAVAALEPAIEPALAWDDVGPNVTFWRGEDVVRTMFGTPIDRSYWAANNPATIAKRNPERLLDLGIYLEVGTLDMLYLHEGAEFLHRILFDAGIAHEYRLVHGAEHVGPSLGPRLADALGFIGRQIAPPGWIDAGVEQTRARFDAMKRAAGLKVELPDPRRLRGR